MPFSKLLLDPNILKAVKAMGYVDPTPIQLRAIPLALEGHDIIGSAQTGTGKTAAFALPILSKLREHGPLRVLVLEPTRELAGQVETSFRDYSRFTTLKTTAIYGGAGFGPQVKAVREADILVATPGRLLDHISRGTVSLAHITNLVLDEADRMLDMGFLPDVRRIVERCPKDRQTFVFSATMPPEIEALVRWGMRTPKTIEIGQRRSPAETVSHALYPISPDSKSKLLLALMEHLNYDSLLVFTRTKHRADRIAKLLKEAGHAVAVLHSNRTQRERERALLGFRDGRYEVMVATDIAARGLDVDSITHVINYDIPQHPEDYVHRIGRTGRALTSGDALSLFVHDDVKHVAAIERYIGRTIERKKLEGFTYPSDAEMRESRPQQSGGNRNSGGNRRSGYGGNSRHSRGQDNRGQRGGHSQQGGGQRSFDSRPHSTSRAPNEAPNVEAPPPQTAAAPAQPGGARPHFDVRQQNRNREEPREGGPRPRRHSNQTRHNPRPWEQR